MYGVTIQNYFAKRYTYDLNYIEPKLPLRNLNILCTTVPRNFRNGFTEKFSSGPGILHALIF